jgi:hypothetical protein
MFHRLLVIQNKLNKMKKPSFTPFDIHKSNLHLANKQLTNVCYTYVLMVFSTKVDKIASTKALLMGRKSMDTICMLT